MEQGQNTARMGEKKPYVTGGVSFVVGFLVAWLIFGGSAAAPSDNVLGDDEKASAVDSLSSDNMVAVSDQAPGKLVVVDSLTIEREGWVAIHEDREGKPGNTLGARKVSAGTIKNLEVPLLRGTVEGKVNYVILHGEDDGVAGYNYKADVPLLDEKGATIMATFKSVTP